MDSERVTTTESLAVALRDGLHEAEVSSGERVMEQSLQPVVPAEYVDMSVFPGSAHSFEVQTVTGRHFTVLVIDDDYTPDMEFHSKVTP